METPSAPPIAGSKARLARRDGRDGRDGRLRGAFNLARDRALRGCAPPAHACDGSGLSAAAASPERSSNSKKRWKPYAQLGACLAFCSSRSRTPDGRVLAALGSASRLLTDPSLGAEETPSVFDLLRSGTVFVSVPVINGGKEVGQINMIGDTADLWPRLLSMLGLTLLASLAALAVGLLIALRFQRAITHPLRRLLGAMQEVRRDHRYDVQVAGDKRSGDRASGRWLQ